jgi:hypothetical protein
MLPCLLCSIIVFVQMNSFMYLGSRYGLCPPFGFLLDFYVTLYVMLDLGNVCQEPNSGMSLCMDRVEFIPVHAQGQAPEFYHRNKMLKQMN